MLKRRYSWPFYFAIIGNLLLWEEVIYQGVSRWITDVRIFSNTDDYFIFLASSIAISMFVITVYQLWINRFPKDQRWQMVIWGVIFSAGAIAVFAENFGMLGPDDLLMGFGGWCLPMLVFYGVRQWRKPMYLKSKFTRPKNMVVMMILGAAIVLAILEALPFYRLQFFDGGNSFLFGGYLIFLQIALPISLLLNVLDHHARDRGKGFAGEQERLIEELGKG